MLSARFESLDRMDGLDSKQVLHGDEKKPVNMVTNQKDSCDVTSYPYAITAFHTILLKRKKQNHDQHVGRLKCLCNGVITLKTIILFYIILHFTSV